MRNIFTLLFVSFACTVFARDFRLSKVSKEELMEKEHPLDPSADAAILYKKGNTHFKIDNDNWVIITEVEVRLKVYTKKGYKYGNVEVPYYYKRVNGESVTFEEASTYNLVNGEIEKTSLKKGDDHTDEVSSTRRVKKIMLQDVKEGSVIEYKYVVKSPYIHSFPDWYFQEKIPVNYIEYTVNIPQLFTYNRILNPYYELKEDAEVNRKSLYARSAKITFQEIKQTYSIENLPAFKTESYIDNPDNYRLYVKHELASFRDLDEKETKYSNNWESVAKTLYDDDDFGSEIKKTSYFKDDIDALINGVNDNDKKLTIVFNYVKERMSWNEKHGLYCSDGVKKAYDERSGNCAEINLMLTAMLRYAGLNANPVVLSTKDNGLATYASIYSYDFVICAVEVNDKQILLDATEPFSSPDMLPVRDLNASGWLLRDNNTWKEVKLNTEKLSKEMVFVSAQLSADGTVSGKMNCKYSDYDAMMYKMYFDNIPNDKHMDELESSMGDIEISDLEYKADTENEAQVSYNFKSVGHAEVVGDMIYLSPLLFHTETENSFNEEKRLYSLDFVYPSQVRYNFVFAIPEGYAIESMPEATRLSSVDGITDFTFRLSSSGNQIQVLCISTQNYSTVGPEYYDSIKEMEGLTLKKQAEKIVLKKI
ncbi:DUF3857 domain-containing protein [Flavobacterium rakeshii]|uniref:DUF3857 domain-containing protein n=1 Tax=Flavobacterium rakeshii TaxID=1038845 RepID=A0A6N8H9G9_9FLAO|nr:DUF3857 domain-containing protein [Flavobacterium rakeshii]MUV02613.1 DUF3857 domain-containing protein [Flavobacterium rakeshii]